MKAEGVIHLAAGGPSVDRLDYPSATLLVLAGAPGAGKTTLARRLLRAPRLEIDAIAAEEVNGHPRGFSAAAALLLERAALSQSSQLVVDSSAVNPGYRRELLRLALTRGLEPHLLGLDASAGECADGLAARPQGPFPPLPADVFDYYQGAWQKLKEEALSGRLAKVEGWRSVTVLDRSAASRLTAIRFELPG